MKLKCGATIKIVDTINQSDAGYGPVARCHVQDTLQDFRVADNEEELEDGDKQGSALEVNISLKAIPALRLFLDQVERRLQRLAKS